MIGDVRESFRRNAKTGWMFMQHFKWETLEADGVIDSLKERCTELRDAYHSAIALSKILRIDPDRQKNRENYSGEDKQNLEEYEDRFLKIVECDRSGKLLNHPYIIENIKQRLRNEWLDLAQSAGIRFYSFMTMRDETLAHYNVWNEDKTFCIDGRVCCCPDLEEGEYIVFVKPMRSWGDCQIWENRHEGLFTDRHGIIAGPKDLFLTVGRDFDGDPFQVMHAEEFPAIAQAVKEFNEPPKIRRLPKEKITEPLQRIAVTSMANVTQLVAKLQGITIAHGMAYHPFIVPVGGTFTEEIEMTIIEFLGQELQIAVNSLKFKSATPNNMAGIEKLQKLFKNRSMSIPWHRGFRDPEVYKSKPCPVDASHEDTVTKLVSLVNSYWWRAADLPETVKPPDFRYTLFSDIPFSSEQERVATEVQYEYQKRMSEAILYKTTSYSSRKLYETLEYFAEKKARVLSKIDSKTGKPYDHDTWVAAFWNICHKAKTSRDGVVFNFFLEEICEALQDLSVPYGVILLIGCQHRELGDFTAYNDTVIDVRFVRKQIMLPLKKVKGRDSNGRYGRDYPRNADGTIKKAPKYRNFAEYYSDEGEWKILGNVAGNYMSNVPEFPLDGNPSPSQQMKVFIVKKIETYGNVQTSQVILLPETVPTELGEAEVDLILRGEKRTVTSVYWKMVWMHDVGYKEVDIRKFFPYVEHPKFIQWMKVRGKKYPWK